MLANLKDKMSKDVQNELLGALKKLLAVTLKQRHKNIDTTQQK